MKDKRLELKLSVRGDGSLGRNSSARSSIRSNRSNISNSSGLPVSEIFANDRFTAVPHNTPFDVTDKYRRRPIQQGYPAQSLQALNNYEQQRYYEYERRDRNPYMDYGEPSRYTAQPQYMPAYEDPRYRPAYQPPSGYMYSTLPRTPIYEYDQRGGVPNSGHNTLPARSSLRRVRISTQRPIVYGYGMLSK